MLQYVLWAREPPLFSEMIDAIAVRLDESPAFKQENRLFELMDVITQCSSLLTPMPSSAGREIHLAHSSVKEYLTSQHLPEPFKRPLSEVHARSIIAKTSIRYMIDVASMHHDSITSSGKLYSDLLAMSCSEVVLLGNSLGSPTFLKNKKSNSPVTIMDHGEFRFLRSAMYWAEYARAVETADDDIPRLVLQLYVQKRLLCGFPQILGLGFIFDEETDEYEYIPGLYTKAGPTPDPLIHACYWGLEIVARRLLETDAQLITSCDFDSPLYAASFSGHHSIVMSLLDRGAEVNGRIETQPQSKTVPLHGATRSGHIDIVRTLLQHGAKVDVLGFRDETAIELAVWYRHQEIVQPLMDSCDYFPFQLLFLALSRWPVEDELVDLICSKRIVPDDKVSSSKFEWLLANFLERNKAVYANLLLKNGSHVPILPSEPNFHWPEPPGKAQLDDAILLLDEGVFVSDYLTQCVKLLVKKEHHRLGKRTRRRHECATQIQAKFVSDGPDSRSVPEGSESGPVSEGSELGSVDESGPE
jgi:hypothetical protein